MRLTSLEWDKYADMSESERQDYVKGWLYIHNRQKNG